MEKLLIVLLTLFCACFAHNVNTFEATVGCLQYNSNHGYDAAHPYYSTTVFKNIRTSDSNATIMRMGILGRSDGHIRLSPVEYPYDATEMNELVISGWSNTKTEIRRYTRTDHKTRINNHVFRQQSSNGMLSEFRPMMFTMEVHADRTMKLIKDGDVLPFVEFRDPKLSFKYMGFCNWDVPVIYFYDCPLELDRRDCSGIVFS